jgi:hypothetical protein
VEGGGLARAEHVHPFIERQRHPHQAVRAAR